MSPRTRDKTRHSRTHVGTKLTCMLNNKGLRINIVLTCDSSWLLLSVVDMGTPWAFPHQTARACLLGLAALNRVDRFAFVFCSTKLWYIEQFS